MSVRYEGRGGQSTFYDYDKIIRNEIGKSFWELFQWRNRGWTGE